MKEMINDIRESTPSLAQNSNSSESFSLFHVQIYFSSIGLPAEDLLVREAIALSSIPENDISSAEETSSTNDDNNSTDTNSGKN